MSWHVLLAPTPARPARCGDAQIFEALDASGGIFTQRTFPGHVWEVGFAAAAELKAGTGDASAPGTSTSDQRAPRGIVRRYRVANGSPIQVIQAAEDLRSSAECLDELV